MGTCNIGPIEGSGPEEVEMGYALHTSAWGKGYATEAVRALIHKGFADLGVGCVRAYAMAVNARSRRVMEKAGLKYVRTLHPEGEESFPGTEHGEVEYALTRGDWERQNAKAVDPATAAHVAT